MTSDGELILCTVIASAPEFGMTILDTCGGTGSTNDRLLGLLPYSDATCGAIMQVHVQDGSTVVCMRSAEVPRVAYILTAVNNIGADQSDTLNGRQFYNTNAWTTWNEQIFDEVLNSQKDFAGNLFRNHANSVDKDVLPGDWDVVNNGSPASIHVGKYLVQVKGSPLAFIDVSAIEDQIRMIASRIDRHTITTFQRVSDDICVDDVAADAAEAFGLPAGTDIDEQTWKKVMQEGVPLFRMQETKGPAVDGKEELTVGFPDGEKIHSDVTIPPVLSKDRTALSGERTVASAKGLSSVKSPAIQAVLQFGYKYTNQQTPSDQSLKLDLLTPYSKSVDKQEEDNTGRSLDAEIMDAAINKLVDKLMTKDYLPVLMQRMMETGLIVSAEPLSLQFKEHTETGPTDQSQYSPPKFLSLVDPVTGQTHLYFDSTSFISQEPDGSILLKDGYGSEIRMSQGNIYISPALDLQLRPGRDMWGLVPRHLSLDAQQYITVNSNKAVYLRSTGDMLLAAAADKDGHGKLVLECDDVTNSETSGLILRSLGNATFTGKAMYIGINKGTSNTANRLEDDGGTIVIDAGKWGSIVEHSAAHCVDTATFTVVADFGSQSAFVVDTTMIGLYTQQVNMPAALNMAPVDGSQKVTVVREGQETELSISTRSDPWIQMKNTTINKGQIHTSSVLAVDWMRTKTIRFKDGPGPMLQFSYNQPDSELFPPVKVENTKTISIVTGSSSLKALSKTIYQDAYISGNCFQFPESYGVAPTIVIPGMCWQEDTRKILGEISSVAWDVKPITIGEKSTAAYPGWAVWESGYISVAGYDQKPLKSNYITNTKKETTNA